MFISELLSSIACIYYNMLWYYIYLLYTYTHYTVFNTKYIVLLSFQRQSYLSQLILTILITLFDRVVILSLDRKDISAIW